MVIGVSDETEEAVKKHSDPKIEYASAIDRQARMKKALEVTGIPHCIIIDPTGIVRWEGFPFLGGHELTEKVIADILATSTDAKGDAGIPYAKPVPGKPGFAFSPYESSKGYIDLRGFPSGTEVKDPYSGKSFLVP